MNVDTHSGPLPDRRTAAVVAGISYAVLFALAIFANFAVREQLVEDDNAPATLQNIADNEGLVRFAIVAFIIAFVLDVLIAWALYHVFRPAGPELSRLTAWFRLVYTVFLGVAVVFLFIALEFVSSASYIATLEQPIREADAMLALDAFNATWMIGLTCFGVHLVLLGVMSLRSAVAPRALGLVLIVAGGAYIFDTLAYSLLANYADHESLFTAIVAGPAVIAEAAFTIWLLRDGGRPATAERQPSSAFTTA
jgi:hypothetical protein